MRIRSSERVIGDPGEVGGTRPLIGTLLGLSDDEVQAVLSQQAEDGRLFGEIAVDMGLATAEDVQRAIGQQQNFTVLPVGDDRVHSLVVAAFDPKSDMARSVRMLRGAVNAYRTADGAPLWALAVLAVDAATEATVIVANLAVAFAQAGRSTLLVDTNIDLPAQDRLFSLPNRTGVSTLLGTDDEALELAQPSAVPRLSVLPSGPAVPNAPELFERRVLVERLRATEELFDQVIIDASRAGISATAVAKRVDAVLIVVRRGSSSQHEVRQLLERLEAQDVPVLGTVLSE